jgi:hypothetical protein
MRGPRTVAGNCWSMKILPVVDLGFLRFQVFDLFDVLAQLRAVRLGHDVSFCVVGIRTRRQAREWPAGKPRLGQRI